MRRCHDEVFDGKKEEFLRVSLIRPNALFWTALSLALFAVAMVSAVNVFAASEAGHAYPHLAGGTIAVLLAVATMRLGRPRGSRMASAARGVLVAGLLLFGGGELLESVGALGWETLGSAPWEYYRIKYSTLAILHDSIMIVMFIAMPILALGVLLTLLPTAARLVIRLRKHKGALPSWR